MMLDTGRRLGSALCALQGLMAVAAGAFGAHATTDAGVRELLRTGAQHQGLHALAGLVAFAALPAAGRLGGAAGWLFCAGAFLFGASLDALALGAPKVMGAITPLGGLAMMLGWLCMAVALVRVSTPKRP